MRRFIYSAFFVVLFLTLVTTSFASGQAEEAAPGASLKAGTKIQAELESTLDTRTAKPGDEVVARVTKDVKQEGQKVLRKGDRLQGRITEVQADAVAESGSHVNVVFDRLVQGESSSQLNAVLSAVLSTPAEERERRERMMREEPMPAPSAPPAPAERGSASASGGLVGGATSTVGAVAGTAGSVAGNVAGGVAGTVDSTVAGAGTTLDAATETTLGSSTGVALATPAKAIRLDSEAHAESQTSTQSMLSTRKGHLRLESGTRLEFRTAATAQSSEKNQ